MNKVVIINCIAGLIFSFSLRANTPEELFYQQFQASFLDTSSNVDIQTYKKLMNELSELAKTSDHKYIQLARLILSLRRTSEQHFYLSHFYEELEQEEFFNKSKAFDKILEKFIIFEDGRHELYEALKPYLHLKTSYKKKPFIENFFCEIYIDRIKNLDKLIPFYIEVLKEKQLRKKAAYSELSSIISCLASSKNQQQFNKLTDLLFINKKYNFLLHAIKDISVSFNFKRVNHSDYFLKIEEIFHIYEHFLKQLLANDSLTKKEAQFKDDLLNLLFDQFGGSFGNLKTNYIERALSFHQEFSTNLALLKSDNKKDAKTSFKAIRKQLKELDKDNFFLDKFYINTLYWTFVTNLKESNLEDYYQKIRQEKENKLRRSFSKYLNKIENCTTEKVNKTGKHFYEKWKNYLYVFSSTSYLTNRLMDEQIDYFFKPDTLMPLMLLKDLLLLCKNRNELLMYEFNDIYHLLSKKYLELSREERQKYDLTQFNEIYKEVKKQDFLIERY